MNPNRDTFKGLLDSLRIHAEFMSGLDEALVSEGVDGKRILAAAVRGNKGDVLGYYERYEVIRKDIRER